MKGLIWINFDSAFGGPFCDILEMNLEILVCYYCEVGMCRENCWVVSIVVNDFF